MTSSVTARLSTKYQLVVPREVREALKLQPHDSVIFLILDDSVYMKPKPKSFTKTLAGLHREVWSGDTDAWLERERSSWQ